MDGDGLPDSQRIDALDVVVAWGLWGGNIHMPGSSGERNARVVVLVRSGACLDRTLRSRSPARAVGVEWWAVDAWAVNTLIKVRPISLKA